MRFSFVDVVDRIASFYSATIPLGVFIDFRTLIFR